MIRSLAAARFPFLLAVLCAAPAVAQTPDSLAAPPAAVPASGPTLQGYEVLSITVEGALDENSQALARSISGLRPGTRVQLPWDPSFGEAIRALYTRGQFSDARIEATEITGDGVSLTIHVDEERKLGAYTIEGLKSSEREELGDRIQLLRGRSVREADIEQGRMEIEALTRRNGYRLATVDVAQSVDAEGRVNVTYTVDKGGRVTVSDVEFAGNEVFSDRTLRRQFKNTPERRWWRFWKRETFDDQGFQEDLDNLIKFYNDRGYYGARVVRDTVYFRSEPGRERDFVVEVSVDEGPLYHIRDVVFEGNTIFNDAQLGLSLGVQSGDVYDRSRIERNMYYTPDHSDISSLYQDRGYLRFNIQNEIVEVPGDSLDLYFEIAEGEIYEFGDVRIAGNTRTKEHVIRREIRTIPGQPFSRQAIERSIRELSTLNYFDPASFGAGPDTNVNDEDRTVDLVYNLSETSSDQLELSGGWGGGNIGLILTARVTFTNFSAQNLFQGGGGMPTGDGQQLSLQVQTYGSRQQVYSLSFTEPWFRGRQTPVGFALSYSNVDFSTVSYGTVSSRLFYRQRLKWPDDFFQTGTNLGYRLYNVRELAGAVLPEGISQELTISQTLSRNALDNPTFPQNGSSLDLSVTVAPPIGDFVQYHKWDVNTAWYTPIVGKLTASVRAQGGYIGSLTGEDVRFQRYLIGGTPLEANSNRGLRRGFGRDLVFLRGYPIEAIGPREDGVPVGGRVLNKFEAEMGMVLIQSPQLSFAPYLFADAANTWDSFDEYDPSRLFRSVGVGARVFLPILGLVDLNYGYQIDAFDPEGVESGADAGLPKWRFQFSLGGR